MSENELEYMDDQSPAPDDDQGPIPVPAPLVPEDEEDNDGWVDGEKVIEDGNKNVNSGGWHGSYKIVAMNKASLTFGSNVDVTMGLKSFTLIGGWLHNNIGYGNEFNFAGKNSIDFGPTMKWGVAPSLKMKLEDEEIHVFKSETAATKYEVSGADTSSTANFVDLCACRVVSDGSSIHNVASEVSSVGTRVETTGVSTQSATTEVNNTATEATTVATRSSSVTAEVSNTVNSVESGLQRTDSTSLVVHL
ncbi:hypothetical protein BA953_00820 [Vibrio coralliilyticus]|uniref:hypothetical protein n=1 Tax=Vibrio coralliilyticus TaxID=190893 RepID=UPI0008109CF8|nr:hypothetical protein [Vibrio coralliilyticus]ANW22859.1 hypothetical protein BA953_00820 [Vibrio coralliilyticus]